MQKKQTATSEIRHGDKFKAYEITTGRKAKVGQPFKATRVTAKKVEAKDRHGWLRVFGLDTWRLEVV